MTYTCAVCADTYTEVIEKSTDHNYTDGVCTVCGGEDPDYVVPEEPSKPEDPSEPTVPSEPTEPDEEESANPIMAILNAILDALKALLAIFGIKL